MCGFGDGFGHITEPTPELSHSAKLYWLERIVSPALWI